MKRVLACWAALLCGAASGEKADFDFGWEFARRDFTMTYGKVGLAGRPEKSSNDNGNTTVWFDGGEWKKVQLPHDWALELPLAQRGANNGFRAVGPGHRENSVGFYRKFFTLPEDGGGRTYLQFDGVCRDAQFWMNGCYLGRNDSAYVGKRFDVTDFLRHGGATNMVTVRVNAETCEGWWYDGAGIYRHVWMIGKPAVHILPEGVFHYTEKVEGGTARVVCETETSEGAEGAEVVWRILESGGRVAGEGRAKVVGGKARGAVEVKGARLWGTEDPYLHVLETKLVRGGETLDEERMAAGLRTFRFDPDRGFILNGKRVQIQGVCCHQDHAGVGVAVPDAIQEYRIRKLKEIGVNGYRTSHNPPSPELLDLCDRYGIVVFDETRLFCSSEEGLSQFGRLIRRDRNHPCVVAWSLGNEEHNVQNGDTGRRIARTMKAYARKLDPSRPVSYGGNNGIRHEGVNEVTDVRGINYVRLMGSGGAGLDKYHEDHPGVPVWGSEEASTLATRGAESYLDKNLTFPDGDEAGVNAPMAWAMTAEGWTARYAERPWLAGAFAWTGFDYRGECRWPAVNNSFGIFDLCGNRKNNAYHYEARWTDKDVLHAYPHWSCERTNLWVNTNCDEVELFVNGKSAGKRKRPQGTYRLAFPVKWEPGTVEARGTRGGRAVEFRMATAGRLARIEAVPDRREIAADGKDATVVDLVARDAAGNEVPDCCAMVTMEEEGAAKIIGVGNGNPLSHEDDICAPGRWRRRFFNGRCQVVVRAGTEPGVFRLRAKGETGREAVAEVAVKPPALKSAPVFSPQKMRYGVSLVCGSQARRTQD